MASNYLKTIQAVKAPDIFKYIQDLYGADIAYDFYDEYNAPSDGAVRFYMAESQEEWENYRRDMFLYYAINRALRDLCNLDWGSSIYILTDY